MTQAQIPNKVYRYFKTVGVVEHPVIAQVYRPDKGWTRYPFKKRISRTWARRHLRPEGVTRVALDAGGHRADFSIKEVTA